MSQFNNFIDLDNTQKNERMRRIVKNTELKPMDTNNMNLTTFEGNNSINDKKSKSVMRAASASNL